MRHLSVNNNSSLSALKRTTDMTDHRNTKLHCADGMRSSRSIHVSTSPLPEFFKIFTHIVCDRVIWNGLGQSSLCQSRVKTRDCEARGVHPAPTAPCQPPLAQPEGRPVSPAQAAMQHIQRQPQLAQFVEYFTSIQHLLNMELIYASKTATQSDTWQLPLIAPQLRVMCHEASLSCGGND